MGLIRQSVDFPGVTPRALFEIYVDPRKHAAAIGAPVKVGRKPGDRFSAFGPDGLRGRNLFVQSGRQIVQAWRAQLWKASDPDSILILTFLKTPRGARIELVHSGVPKQAVEEITRGWRRSYWTPWKAYLKKLH